MLPLGLVYGWYKMIIGDLLSEVIIDYDWECLLKPLIHTVNTDIYIINRFYKLLFSFFFIKYNITSLLLTKCSHGGKSVLILSHIE